ncbi:hypothetical protein OH77DRAFT_265050 [Trametes cingulata]|nr:hypothetical protein OH77DRAFT_265050 [Trametes cingulata]
MLPWAWCCGRSQTASRRGPLDIPDWSPTGPLPRLNGGALTVQGRNAGPTMSVVRGATRSACAAVRLVGARVVCTVFGCFATIDVE